VAALLAGVVAVNVVVLQLNMQFDGLGREARAAEGRQRTAALAAVERVGQRANRDRGSLEARLVPADPNTTTYLQAGAEVVNDKRANVRIRLLLLVFGFLFAVTFARAAWIQVVRAPELRGDGVAATPRDDRDSRPGGGRSSTGTGEPLAIGEQAITVYADPRNVVAPKKAADQGGTALASAPTSSIPSCATGRSSSSTVDRKADALKAGDLEKQHVSGLGFYPRGAAHVSAGARRREPARLRGPDNFGLDGLEKSLDRTLAGRSGLRDRRARTRRARRSTWSSRAASVRARASSSRSTTRSRRTRSSSCRPRLRASARRAARRS
jgi:hypothetical protein